MNKKAMNMMILSAIFALTVTGCNAAGNENTTGTSAQTAAAESTAEQTTAAETAAVRETITFDIPSDNPAETQESKKNNSGNVTGISYQTGNGGMLDTADLFSDRDLSQTADLTAAKTLTASDGATLSITEAGVYVLTGTASNCTVTVNAGKEDKVQLVLDNLNITNSDFPAIYVVSADKVFVTSTGTNTLSVTGSFRADGDTNTDAVIYSKDDLVLNGTGSLQISSAAGNGITSKDDLKVTGGTYAINSKLDAVEANDSISVCGGSFTIRTDKDGFHCENDSTEGTIYISGGNLEIQAGSDGVQATSILQIDGGTFNITASEGMEATYVQINDGSIIITASDDGINAAAKSSAVPVVIEFNGGETTISMGQGDTDAVDANGSIYVNGGTINITAPTSSFDYDQTAEFNGGTIIINGEQVSEIPQSMMGGPGFGGGHGGFQPGEMPQNGERPEMPQNGQRPEKPQNGQGGFPGKQGNESNTCFSHPLINASGVPMPGAFPLSAHKQPDDRRNERESDECRRHEGKCQQPRQIRAFLMIGAAGEIAREHQPAEAENPHIQTNIRKTQHAPECAEQHDRQQLCQGKSGRIGREYPALESACHEPAQQSDECGGEKQELERFPDTPAARQKAAQSRNLRQICRIEQQQRPGQAQEHGKGNIPEHGLVQQMRTALGTRQHGIRCGWGQLFVIEQDLHDIPPDQIPAAPLAACMCYTICGEI